MAVNDTSFFKLTGQYGGLQYVHTLHFRHLSLPVGGADPDQSLIDDWQSSCQSAWLNAHFPNYTLQTLSSQIICGSLPLPAPTVESSGLVGLRGSLSSDPLPPWICMRANEATRIAGRTRHGAFYFSGGAEQDVNGEALLTGAQSWYTLANAYVTALMTRYGSGATPGTSSDFRLVVHSRKLADVPGTQCQDSSTLVHSCAITARLTTNRSRRA